MRLAARLTGKPDLYGALSLALTPLGSAGLFLGLSATTVKLLRYEGLLLEWVQPARALLLIAAMAWSAWLGWKLLARQDIARSRRCAVSACLLAAIATVGYGWWLQFWGWL
ncbi:hypothetical protein D3C76_1317810 [compost metagenome]